MKGKTKTIILLVGLVVLFVAAIPTYNLLSGRYAAENLKEEEAGEAVPAPDFVMYDGDGNAVSLSDLRGKPVVLNFWASWCPPCKGEMPEFDRVWNEMQGEVQFVMVDIVDGSQETQQAGMDYIAEQGYSFPVYYDLDQAGAIAYGIRSIPNTYFIDAHGYAVAVAQTAIDEETLRLGISMAIEAS